MKIPFLDLKKVNAELEQDIHLAVKTVIDSGWYILGKSGEIFEQNSKTALVGDGEGYVLGCNSGTDALVLSLLAAGVGPGDEVITVSHTAIPTVCAINAVGAHPVYVDIDADTWVMDVNQFLAAVTHKTRAVIPVHLYGNMVDMDSLKNDIASIHESQINIIEDVAQAQGSRLTAREAGTLGRLGAFSFYPSKNIGALGDGGAVFCHFSEDMIALKSLRNYGQHDRYSADRLRGINSRLDEVQAAILDIKLKRLHEWNQKKSTLMRFFRNALSDLPIQFQKITPGCEPAWHLCVIALADHETRESLFKYLNNEGIQTLIHYPIPNHRQKAFDRDSQQSLPVTENLAKKILSLPFNTALSQENIEYMMGKIRSFFSHNKTT